MASKKGTTKGKLTEKQRKFVQEYLIDLNATQAAIRAGYSSKTADSAASRLLGNVKVQAYIQEQQNRLQSKTEITQEKVLNELAKVGFASLTDYLEYKTVLREVGKDADGEPMYDYAMTVNAIESEAVDGAPIQEVSIGKDGTFKFKLYNKLDALDKLGKHLGLFEQKEEEGKPIVIAFDKGHMARLQAETEALNEVGDDG
ncbi:MAG: terminase small subunit [Clostridiales bacterium]|nr:terminase small subunit [Clostridiales bacterium]